MSKLKGAMERLSKSTARLVAATVGINSATEILVKTQEALDKASDRLALAAVKLKKASDSIRLNNFKNKIYLEDEWEVDITFQEEKGYLDIINVKNIKTHTFYQGLRFDRGRQVFLDKKYPDMSAEVRATLTQALNALTAKTDDTKEIGVLN